MTAMSVLLVHGAGSSGDAARALLGDSLASFETVEVIEDRTGDIGALLERLDRTAGSTKLAIGVSLGAHALARWSADRLRGPALMLCLPAWTSAPDSVALATAHTSQRLHDSGRAALMADLPHDRRSGIGRVAELVRRGWESYDERDLISVLATAARQPGPTVAQLASINAPAALLSWPDDALHPDAVARLWADLIPTSRHFAASALDPIELQVAGRRAVDWLRARGALR